MPPLPHCSVFAPNLFDLVSAWSAHNICVQLLQIRSHQIALMLCR